MTIVSFQAHGHPFVLWTYDDLETPLPPATIVRDAAEVIPRDRVFAYQSGHQAGSVAGFSDLFRYRLLQTHGGWWVDMDVVCLRTFDFPAPYVLRPHPALLVTGNILKTPPDSTLMHACYERALRDVTSLNRDWFLPIRILAEEVRRQRLTEFIRPLPDFGGPEGIHWLVRPGVVPPPGTYAVHWCHEWTRHHPFDPATPVPGTFYHACLERYGL